MMTLMNGQSLPRIGQGTWFMGEKPALADQEIAALRKGVELGMTLIDTAEMYGEGASEELVGEAITPFKREDLFLVTKVYPHNAGGARLERACERSLERLGVDTIDLYLLHWRGSIPLRETIAGMHKLQQEGKIRYWGVSNLDRYDMQELIQAGGRDCAANQVLYHLGSRGVEFDLLPWLQRQSMPMMAYSPLAQAGTLRRGLTQNAAVRQIAANRGWTELQVLLAFAAQPEGVIAIPKSGTPAHTAQNAAILSQRLTEEEMALLNAAYPSPTRPEPLDMI